jgi:hypothetical protein
LSFDNRGLNTIDNVDGKVLSLKRLLPDQIDNPRVNAWTKLFGDRNFSLSHAENKFN